MTEEYRNRLREHIARAETREVHNFVPADPFQSVAYTRCWMKENGIEFMPEEFNDSDGPILRPHDKGYWSIM